MLVFQFATKTREPEAVKVSEQVEIVNKAAIAEFAKENPEANKILQEETGRENPKRFSKPEMNRIMERIMSDEGLKEEYKKIFMQKAKEMGYDAQMLWNSFAKQQQRKMEFELAKIDNIAKTGPAIEKEGSRAADEDYKKFEENAFLRHPKG
ncbi:hypothetical protein COU37_02155 [Candidatus Micrarchaeota archaeon CG10_big_fil_rev_8_21_14_0_10_45_29]|nr:MAG: hypothetical protein COU37_02155 [Candidatus Micrarchaeota archaeon CG10_big_fil_rev_8_21_14_0_10_45_29]